jgi:hypothetical protein
MGAFIGVFEMVVLIVLIGTIGKIVSKRMALQKVTPAVDAENQRLQSEVARLNERIHVLERLATDPAKRLSDEIESLKDK